MTEILYIDTNVVIDAVEDRTNLFGKNIGNPAADVFFDAISCKYKLILSDWFLKELDGLAKLESAKMFFQMVKHKWVSATYSEEEVQQAKERSSEHWRDALHIIIAERENADRIITRNKDDFLQIGTNIPVNKPEDLL